MVYDIVDSAQSISQGDIFTNIPRVDMKLSEMVVNDEEGCFKSNWATLVNSELKGAVTALLSVTPVTAIVITQDCDASREDYISLCVVDDYLKLINQDVAPSSAKKWANLVVRSRSNPKIFYLPEDTRVGFETPKGASFLDVLRVPMWDLMEIRNFRVGTLNPVANEHFRESLGHFFRRYSYNEWYPLTREQFQAYRESMKSEEISPYDWQK